MEQIQNRMMDLHAFYDADLRVELCQRRRSPKLRGRFRYGVDGVVSDRGRIRKQRVSAKSFTFSLQSPEHDISLLLGHSFDRAVSSKVAGSLRLIDGPDALEFESDLPLPDRQPSWLRDSLLDLENGLHPHGISPGFVVPPATAVSQASELIEELGTGVLIENFLDVRLFELSIVSKPRFPETEVNLNAASPGVTEPGHVDLEYWRRRIWL